MRTIAIISVLFVGALAAYYYGAKKQKIAAPRIAGEKITQLWPRRRTA